MPKFYVQLERTEAATVEVETSDAHEANIIAGLNAFKLMSEATNKQDLGSIRVAHVFRPAFTT